MLKESDNPPLTWPETTSVTNMQGQWQVAHTRSRNEKALAHDLQRKNISYFLPMTWSYRRTRGRKIRSLLPVFPGYVFICSSEEERLAILQTNRVAHLIETPNQEQLVWELEQIERTLKSGLPMKKHEYLQKGQKCRVVNGPLEGTEGTFEKEGSATRLILHVEMLGQAASVEIDADMVEIID